VPWDGAESGTPPEGVLPVDGECHLWVARLEDDPVDWGGLLDEIDLTNVSRLQRPADRRTLTVSRGLQRHVVARYLGIDARQVVVRRVCEHCGDPTHGRPTAPDAAPLDFSVSHQGEWIAMAVVGSGRVGLDLELRRSMDDRDDLAAVVLTPDEAAVFTSLPEATKQDWLYRTWVRKEAVVKLTGHGLETEVADVDVRRDLAVFSGEAARAPGVTVRLRDLPAPDGYCAALASTRAVDVVRLCSVDSEQ
jgi:4'-phosphopantetheinyl transferase